MTATEDVAPSRELRFLLACARGEAVAVPALDWRRLLWMATRHRLTPQVAQALAGRPEVPAEVVATLARGTRQAAVTGLAQAAEMVRVTTVLEAAGIPALALKGPVEALLCRGGLGQRPSSDIDLHVAEEHIAGAIAALGQAGWRPDLPGLAQVAGKPWVGAFECTLRRAAGAPAVELHWRFTSTFATFPLTMAEALGRSIAVELAGGSVRTLPTAERFLFLCAHGCKHGWAMVSHLLDIAVYLHRGIPPEIAGLARRMRLRRVLTLSVHLAHVLLAAPLPAWLPEAGPADSRIRRLAGMTVAAMDLGPDEPDGWGGGGGRVRRLRYGWALAEGPSGKLSLLHHLLPNEQDIAGGGGPLALAAARFRRLAGWGWRRVLGGMPDPLSRPRHGPRP